MDSAVEKWHKREHGSSSHGSSSDLEGRYEGRSRIISYQNQKTMPGGILVQRQITFRRASAAAIKVSIIPGPDHNSQEARRLQGYVKEGLESLTSDARYPPRFVHLHEY